MGGGSSKNLLNKEKDASAPPAPTAQGSFKLENAKPAWGKQGSSKSMKGENSLAKVATPEFDPSKVQSGDMEMQDLDMDDHVNTDWKQLAEKIPMEKTPRGKEKRRELFAAWDVNANGYLSLAELDKGIKQTSGLENLHKCKPAMMRAYQAAKDVKKGKAGGRYDDFVSRCEFRVLLVYLRLYFELYHIFSSVDAGHDKRIDLQEFTDSADKLRKWGATIEDPETTFAEVDGNGGGQILFNEFAEWAIANNARYKECQDDDEE